MAILLASLGAMIPSSALAATAPHYVSIVRTIDVARSAPSVWARVGHYCDLSKWLGAPCQIVAGKDGQIGVTRLVNHSITEILIGQTATSYSYAQPETAGAQTHFYHGTLDVEPTGPHSSRIVYMLFYDNAAITDPTARAKELEDRSALFEKAIKKMKSLAESPATGG